MRCDGLVSLIQIPRRGECTRLDTALNPINIIPLFMMRERDFFCYRYDTNSFHSLCNSIFIPPSSFPSPNRTSSNLTTFSNRFSLIADDYSRCAYKGTYFLLVQHHISHMKRTDTLVPCIAFAFCRVLSAIILEFRYCPCLAKHSHSIKYSYNSVCVCVMAVFLLFRAVSSCRMLSFCFCFRA